MRAIIVEDNPHSVEQLRGHLLDLFPGLEIAGDAASPASALELYDKARPDIIFLDIRLNDGDGFQLLQRLHQRNQLGQAMIIFITQYGTRENLRRALAFSALDCIDKPFHREDVRQVVERAVDHKRHFRNLRDQLDLLLRQQPDGRRFAYIAVPMTDGEMHFLEVEDIIYLESSGNQCHFHLDNKHRKLTGRRNLGYFANLLLPHHQFFRISQSLLVNCSFIEKFVPAENLVRMRTGEILYASRSGSTLFRRYLNDIGQLRENGREALLRQLIDWLRTPPK